MSSDDDNFLARWSKRKHAARRGEAPAEPAPAESSAAEPAPPPAPAPSAAPELPPIDSLKGLESDYKDFLRPDVDPATKSAALRKLFGDPHFNRMDGLDIYIDDYTKEDPIPPTMLRAHQARTLGLFDDEEKAAAADTGRRARRRSRRSRPVPRRSSVEAARPTRRWPAAPAKPDRPDMALDGKTLKVCNCNRTMALDAKALAAALQSGAAHDPHRALPARGGRVRRCDRRRRRVHRRLYPGGGALRRAERERGCEERAQVRQHPRDRRLVGGGGRGHPEDRRLACARRSARARAGAERVVQVEWTRARHRSGRGRGAVGGTARGRARGQRPRHDGARR
jgi:hypothetical protein